MSWTLVCPDEHATRLNIPTGEVTLTLCNEAGEQLFRLEIDQMTDRPNVRMCGWVVGDRYTIEAGRHQFDVVRLAPRPQNTSKAKR